MNETQVEGFVDNPVAGSSNATSEPETIFIQVRRSQRRGKKKVDPDFIGAESESVAEGRTDPLILEAIEPSNVIKHEQNNQITSQEDNADWEGFSDEYPEFSVVPHPGKYECKDCSKSFHHKNDLVRHMNIHNGTKPYVCDICGKKFLRSDYLRLHAIKHKGVKPLQCDVCERRFYDRSNLRQHMRTHTGEKPAMCPFCPHRCSQLSDMRKHLTIHTKEKAFQCDTCGKTFSLKTGLVQHQRLHTGERPFACEYCPKKFRDHTSMRRHRRIHTGDKPFLCTHCGKTFTQVANMKRHMMVHQSDNKGRLYPCPFCGVELASKSDVRSHVAKEHEQKKESGLIVPDGNTNPLESNAIHVMEDKAASSETESNHVCNLCGKVFPLDASLQEHVRTHMSAKEHQCETCGKTFCQASSLKAHQLVHSGQKPYSCSACGVSFRKTHHLRRHFLLHTGERPYPCDFCDKTFTSSGNLNKHRAIHMGEKKFQCEYCPKKFTQSSNLSKHRSVHLRQEKVAVDQEKKSRGGTRKRIQPQVAEDAYAISLTMTEEELRQEAEGTAVLHIVSPSQCQNEESINDHEEGAEVSYVTLSDGDIIIEI